MNEYIKYFDNLDQAEGYEIREIPFSGYVKEPNLALFSKRWGDIKEGEVSYDRYLLYTTNDGSTVGLLDSSEFPELLENVYLDVEGVMKFDGAVTSIGKDAFRGCSSLTSVTIPKRVTSIGEMAFEGCSGLTSIAYEDTQAQWNAITKGYSWNRGVPATHVQCTDGHTEVSKPGEDPANNEIWYTSTDRNTVTPYQTDAFGANIINNSYEDGRGVITFDGDVTSIGYWAFHDCFNLTSITIPKSVTSIGEEAFNNCSGLTSITCESTIPPTLYSNNYLSNVTAVYVPVGSVDAYKYATNWSYYSSIIQPIL